MNEELKSLFTLLLEPGEYSDCTIICGDHTLKAHKAILCTQSEYFKAALDSAFSVSKPSQRTSNRLLTRHAKEGISSRIELKDEDPSLVYLAMHFFYTTRYDAGNRNSKPRECRKRLISETEPDPSELRTNVEMFFLADMLLADQLKSFAMSQIEKCFANPAPADLDTVLGLVYDRPDPASLPFSPPLIKFCSKNLEALYGDFAGEGIKNMPPDFFLRVLRSCGDFQEEERKEVERWKKEVKNEQAESKRLKKELSIHQRRWSLTTKLCKELVRCSQCEGEEGEEGSLQLSLNPGSDTLPRFDCNACAWACWSNGS